MYDIVRHLIDDGLMSSDLAPLITTLMVIGLAFQALQIISPNDDGDAD